MEKGLPRGTFLPPDGTKNGILTAFFGFPETNMTPLNSTDTQLTRQSQKTIMYHF
jgi:hypothetical protein